MDFKFKVIATSVPSICVVGGIALAFFGQPSGWILIILGALLFIGAFLLGRGGGF
jgi:hypothetical protein